MRILAGLVALLVPATAAADGQTTAEVRAGLGVIGMSTDGGESADGLQMVRGYTANGVLAGSAGGDVFLSGGAGARVGFAFAYARSRTFRSVTEAADGTEDNEFETIYSVGSLGAVARVRVAGGARADLRIAVGRSRLAFVSADPDNAIDPGELPASEFRYLRIGGELAQTFGTIRIGVGAGMAPAYRIAGAAAEVMGESRGLVFDGRLVGALAIGPVVEILAAPSATLLVAGDFRERHYGFDLGVGVRL